jgi:hypothetical protein
MAAAPPAAPPLPRAPPAAWHRWIWNAISCGVYPYIFHQLWHMYSAGIREARENSAQTSLRMLRNVTVLFWTLFPIVWLLVQVCVCGRACMRVCLAAGAAAVLRAWLPALEAGRPGRWLWARPVHGAPSQRPSFAPPPTTPPPPACLTARPPACLPCHASALCSWT